MALLLACFRLSPCATLPEGELGASTPEGSALSSASPWLRQFVASRLGNARADERDCRIGVLAIHMSRAKRLKLRAQRSLVPHIRPQRSLVPHTVEAQRLDWAAPSGWGHASTALPLLAQAEFLEDPVVWRGWIDDELLGDRA